MSQANVQLVRRLMPHSTVATSRQRLPSPTPPKPMARTLPLLVQSSSRPVAGLGVAVTRERKQGGDANRGPVKRDADRRSEEKWY
jgi:hypothetical protein